MDIKNLVIEEGDEDEYIRYDWVNNQEEEEDY